MKTLKHQDSLQVRLLTSLGLAVVFLCLAIVYQQTDLTLFSQRHNLDAKAYDSMVYTIQATQWILMSFTLAFMINFVIVAVKIEKSR